LNQKKESGAIHTVRVPGKSDGGVSDETSSSSSLTGDLAWGVAGAIAFVITATALTIMTYVYGSLAEVTPEFPMVLSTQFLLLVIAIMAGSPCISIMAARRFSGSRLGVAFPAGAGAGFLIAVTLWLEVHGAGGNPFDWPNLLWFLEVGFSGAAAGAVVGTGVSRAEDCRIIDQPGWERRTDPLWMFSLALVLLVVLASGIPFFLLWSAKESFRDRARDEASSFFSMPGGTTFSVVDEGAGIEATGSNRRFRAVGNWEADGRAGMVFITGDRRGYDVVIDSISASLQSANYPYQGLIDWDDGGSGSIADIAVRELAGSFCLKPLSYKSSSGSEQRSRAIYLTGEGIVAIARPVRVNNSSDGIYITFSIDNTKGESKLNGRPG